MLKALKTRSFRGAVDYCMADMEKSIRADKWRNLMFDREGRSYRATDLHDNEEEAKKAAEACIHRCEKCEKEGSIQIIESLDGDLLFADFAYAMQMSA